MPIDLRTLLAIVLTLTLASAGLGRDLPLDASAPLPFVTSTLLFVGYLYLCRTLVRLPFAIVIAVRRAVHAREHYQLDARESLRDGFARGFLDTRRWTVSPLALVDRLAVFGFTLLATVPLLGALLVIVGGMVGLSLMLMLYLLRGNFSFLVDDNIRDNSSANSFALPFLKTRD
jgi:hypothetical protein